MLHPNTLIEVESLIRSRICLPTNQRKLESFGLKPVDLVAEKKKVAAHYKTFDSVKQGQFITLIGGPVHYEKVKTYLETL